MANYNLKKSDTSVRLGPVRFSFPNVFAPRADNNGNEKYSVCVIIPKSDTQTVEMFNQAVEAAKLQGKAAKWGGKIPARLKEPLRDGDIDREDDEAFADCYFFNCSTKNKPDVAVLNSGEILTALDDSDFYAGCWGAITVNLYPYSSNGNLGIGVGLQNVLKTKDDERLSGGGASAESDFGDLTI